MPVNAKTDYAEFVFAVKEFGDGTPWIMCEPRRGGLPVLGNGYLGFRLPPDTDIEKAQEIASFLRDNIEAISYTGFE